MSLSARVFLDALEHEHGDEELVAEGYARVVTMARRSALHLLSHQPVDAAHDFFEYLLSDAGRPTLQQLQTWSGLERALVRYTQSKNASTMSIDRLGGLYRRRLWEQVGEALRHDARFERVDGLGGAARYALAGRVRAERLARPIGEDLPRLAVALDEPRRDRHVAVAQLSDIKDQIERILVGVGNAACSRMAIFQAVWNSLEVEPRDPKAVDDFEVQAEADPQHAVLGAEWAARADVEAFAIVSRLAPGTRAAAQARYRHPDQRLGFVEVGRELGVSKSTAHKEDQAFEQALERLTVELELDKDETRLLLELVLEILRADDFDAQEEP